MVVLKEAVSKAELKKFVTFPFSLYRGSKYWVPPMIDDELRTFDSKLNPAFMDADAWFFMAYKGKKAVGRIAIIVNRLDTEVHQVSKVRFGWFDFVDDPEVSEALIQKVSEIGKQHGLSYMEGPMGFSNLDKVGLLVEGYDHIGSMATWYHYPYYKVHYERLGMTREKEYVESSFSIEDADPAVFRKLNMLVKRRYGLKELNYTKSADMLERVDEMFDLFNEAYADLSSFIPVTEAQKDYFKQKYLGLVDPEYVKFIVDGQDKMIAFAIVMPSFAKALQKARGRLFPFGFLHLLRAKKKNDKALFYLIGVHPSYQNKGVTAIIFNEYYNTLVKKKVKMCYRTPELANNLPAQRIWKHFSPVVFKRRCTFRKNLD